MSPHTAEACATVLHDTITGWGILGNVDLVATDDGNEVISRIGLLKPTVETDVWTSQVLIASLNHQSCIHLDINFCVNSCLRHILKEVLAMRNQLSSLRVSVKRRNLFAVTKITLGQCNASLLDLMLRNVGTLQLRCLEVPIPFVLSLMLSLMVLLPHLVFL